MSNYTFKQIECHQLDRIYEYSFDVKDQDQWEDLLEEAKSNGESVESFPNQAPSDPQVWIEVIRLIPIDELTSYEDDCWTMRKGGYDIVSQLLNEDGNEI